MTSDEKAGIREVYDLVKPINDKLNRLETKFDEFIKTYDKGHKEIADDLEITIEKNTEEHKSIIAVLQGKISIKAFAVWLSVTGVVISGIIGYLKFLQVI